MIVVAVLGWVVIHTLAAALVQSAVLGRLWEWFLAHEYGPGPSPGAWFGLATILNLMIGMAVPMRERIRDRSEPSGQLLRRMMTHSLASWASCGVVLGFAWCVGSAMGWVKR